MSDEPTMTINAYGTKEWRQNGQLHRIDGPAIEWANGVQGVAAERPTPPHRRPRRRVGGRLQGVAAER
jgi:hypothetical protein